MNRNYALVFIPAADLVAGLGACSAANPVHAPSLLPSHSLTAQTATPTGKPSSAAKHVVKHEAKPATAPAHSAKPTAQPSVTHSQPTASAQAPAPTTYRCALVTDLGARITEYQHTSPDYEGAAYCDAASVAVVQRGESMQQKQSNTDSGGKVHCTYLRMNEVYCTDGTYVSDPSEKDFDK